VVNGKAVASLVTDFSGLRQDLAIIREERNEFRQRNRGANRFVIPYERNAYFTGRERLLVTIHEELSKSMPKRWNHRIALHGLGGVGKTQLALEYAFSQRENYSGVYWINAVSQATLFSGFQDIAKQTLCVANPETMKPSELTISVLDWLKREENWLLVFDNLEDGAVVDGYLPDLSPKHHTLITSRNQHYDQIPAEGLEIGVLEVEDAINLLLTRCKLTFGDSEDRDIHTIAVEIVRELGFLPLAIEQAAAYIREASKNIFTFLSSYRRNRKNYHARLSKGNRKYYSESLATTWRLSFQRIQEINNDASKILQLLAFANPDGTLIQFLEAGANGLDAELRAIVTNPDRLCEALAVLQGFSFIRRQGVTSDAQFITIHRLVQSVIRDEMPPERLSSTLVALIGLCDSAFPTWHDWDPRLLHRSRLYEDQVVGPLLDVSIPPSETLAFLLSRVGLFLREDGKYLQANEFLTKALKIFDQLRGNADYETLNSMALLAWGYLYQGQYQKAAKLEEQVLETRFKLLGDEHPDTLETMADLARMYRTLALYGKAEQLKEHVLAVRKRICGEEHPDTLSAMGYLAHTYRDHGRLREAAELEENVLEARLKLCEKEHPTTLAAMGNLGCTYHCEGRYQDAAQLEEKVLEATMRLLGKEHPESVLAMVNLGCTFRELGRLDDAIVLLETAVERRKQLGGCQHPATLWAQFNLCVAYLKQGASTSSIELLEETGKGLGKALGEGHPRTLSAMHSLAVAYRELGRRNQSRELMENVAEARERILGGLHPDTLASVKELNDGGSVVLSLTVT
jgi:tetratricopeptide (TPR) repeat protein